MKLPNLPQLPRDNSLLGRRLLVVLGLISTFVAILLIPAAFEGHAEAQQPAAGSGVKEAGVVGLTMNDHSIEFTLHSPYVNVDGRVDAPGLDGVIQEPGSPALPFFSTFIAVPPEARIRLEVSEKEVIVLEQIDVEPVPTLAQDVAPGILEQGMLAIDNSRLVADRNPEIYLKNAFFPAKAFQVSEPEYLRDIRLVRLELYPLRHNPQTNQLTHVRRMEVTLSFEGPELGSGTVPGNNVSSFARNMTGLALNSEQIEQWRGLPAGLASTTTTLPLDRDVYRLEVNQDGIYEVSYEDLSTAGMNVASVNPATIEMMYRGEATAYEFVGDDDNAFEPGEKLRFLGWAFNGTSHEQQFVTNNVYWLWADGSPTEISSISATGGAAISTFQSTVTTGPELVWWPGYTDDWDMFPNDPDPWYWDITTAGSETLTKTYQVDLLHPASGAGEALFTAEFGSFDGIASDQLHTVHVTMNDLPISSTLSWFGERNVNVTGTVPLSSLVDGQNSFEVAYSTDGFSARIALNRISVSYERDLIATNDQIYFDDTVGGARQYVVGEFEQQDLDQLFAWDVTNPRIPARILTNTVIVSGSGPYNLTIPADRPAGSKFLVTTAGNILTPESIVGYTPTSLDPATGAEWVVVTHHDFLTEANRLAQHREDAAYGGLRTYVVDVDDILNQYGYGLPLPSAIQDYLAHALDKQYVPTDLVFADRWQGQIPSDLTFALLVGDDMLPDIAVGRIPAQDKADAANIVDKIIKFEQNQLQSFSWMENLLFVSDNADSAGNFCLENQAIADRLPESMNSIQLCLNDYPDGGSFNVGSFREDMFAQINQAGTTFVNYRGHGAISSWGGAPLILSEQHINEWNNPLKPVVILTGDCLDGHFAYPPSQGLGELFLKKKSAASAAHWGSAGFGYSTEHSRLIESFYDGVFLAGYTAIGDAVNYAKVNFASAAGHPSVLHGFSLQGDPAMQLMRPELALNAQVQPGHAARGESVDIELVATNSGLYPSSVVVSNTLPVGLSYVTATASISAGITTIGRNVLFDLQFGDGVQNKGLPRNAVAFMTITAQVDHNAETGIVTNLATITGTGLEAWPGDESAAVDVAILERILHLPVVLTN
jgi:hypothetical protein